MKQPLAALLLAATIPMILSAADATKEAVKPGGTNAPPVACVLSTNQPSCFYADNGTGATYVKFTPDGCYEVIQKEHMGVFPWGNGRWAQATNGVITLTSANKTPGQRVQQEVRPMTYRARTFLVWPEVSYKSNLQQACSALDAGRTPSYHEFMISEEQYKQGTAKPYPFKYHKELNRITGAQE